METNEHTSNTYKFILILGLLLLAFGGLYYWSQSRQPTVDSDQSKSEPGLSKADKKQLTDQIDELRSQLADAKQENASLTDQMDALNELLSQTFDRLGALEDGRTDRFYKAWSMNHDLADQDRLRDSLSNQLALVNGKVDRLSEANQQVNNQNSELQRSLTLQEAKLQTMVSTSAVTGDGFRVNLLKSNEKVTAKAKKVNTVDLTFTVPAERRLEGTKDVYLSLVHESGRATARPLPLATINLPSGNLMIPIDALQTVTFNRTKQQINFKFHPAVELKPGTYRASIYTSDAYLGSVAVQLRDSFWFF